MTETGISFTCPLCGVTIPLPHTDTPTPEGLTVTFDDTYALEHMVMHADCICEWSEKDAEGIARINGVDFRCRLHGSGRTE